LYADNNPENNGASAQVLHPGSRLLFRNWEALRGAAPCPARESFRLDIVKSIAPQIFILNYVPYENSFRYRLAGTGLTDFYGRDMTRLDMLAGWDQFERQMQLRVLRNAQVRQQPALMRTRHFTASGEDYGAEIIALPFSMGEGRDHQLIGGLFPFVPVRNPAFVRQELVTVRSIWTEHNAGETLLKSIEKKGTPMLRVIAGGKG
jgi:hypothetical protein